MLKFSKGTRVLVRQPHSSYLGTIEKSSRDSGTYTVLLDAGSSIEVPYAELTQIDSAKKIKGVLTPAQVNALVQSNLSNLGSGTRIVYNVPQGDESAYFNKRKKYLIASSSRLAEVKKEQLDYLRSLPSTLNLMDAVRYKNTKNGLELSWTLMKAVLADTVPSSTFRISTDFGDLAISHSLHKVKHGGNSFGAGINVFYGISLSAKKFEKFKQQMDGNSAAVALDISDSIMSFFNDKSPKFIAKCKDLGLSVSITRTVVKQVKDSVYIGSCISVVDRLKV